MKKIISIFLTILITLSFSTLMVFAAEETTVESTKTITTNLNSSPVEKTIGLNSLEAPKHLAYSVNNNGTYDSFCLSYFVSEQIARLIKDNGETGAKFFKTYIQTDWRINGGKWHYEKNWDTYPRQGFGVQINSVATIEELFATFSEYSCQLLGIKFGTNNHFDLTKNSLEMKSRYCVVTMTNSDTEENNIDMAVSGWSNPAKVTNSKDFDTTKLTKELKIKNSEVVFDETLKQDPYISFSIDWNEDIKEAFVNILAKDNRMLSLVCEKQKGNTAWTKTSDIALSDAIDFNYDDYKITIPPTEVISDTPIRYRISLSYDPGDSSKMEAYKASSADVFTYDYAALSETKTEITEPDTKNEEPEKKTNVEVIRYCLFAFVIVALAIAVFVLVKTKKEDKGPQPQSKDKSDK